MKNFKVPLSGRLDGGRAIEVRFLLLPRQSTELSKVNLPKTFKRVGTEHSGDMVLSDFEKNQYDLRIKYFPAGMNALSLIRRLREEGFGISYARHDTHQFWQALVLEFHKETSEDLFDLLDVPALNVVLKRTFQQLEVEYRERGSVQQIITFGNQRNGPAGYNLTLDPQNGWVPIPRAQEGSDPENSVRACA